MSSISVKRMQKEIMLLQKANLCKERIYYKLDEENIFHLHILFIGPKETPYENGVFVFEFFFNENTHPHTPPRVIFHQGYTRTRIHPNFYTDGKVCLSILNTWAGPCWSSCQNVISIIRIIQTLFDKNPLQFEPGYQKNYTPLHKDFSIHVTYENIKNNYLIASRALSLGSQGQQHQTMIGNKFLLFKAILTEHIRDTYEETLKNIENIKEFENYHIDLRTYNIAKTLQVHDLKTKYSSLKLETTTA